MPGYPVSLLMLPLGLCAAVASADSVEFVVLSNTNGQQVSTPASLYVSLVRAGEISSNVAFGTDSATPGDGAVISSTTRDLSTVLSLMIAGPDNRASTAFSTFDSSILPPGEGTDGPAGDPGSLIEEIASDGSDRDTGRSTPPAETDDPGAGIQVVVPLPGAGAMAAIGIGALMIRPRR